MSDATHDDAVTKIRKQRLAHREIDLLFEEEDEHRRRQKLEIARQQAQGDEALLDVLRWIAVLTLPGGHPTKAIEAWCANVLARTPH